MGLIHALADLGTPEKLTEAQGSDTCIVCREEHHPWVPRDDVRRPPMFDADQPSFLDSHLGTDLTHHLFDEAPLLGPGACYAIASILSALTARRAAVEIIKGLAPDGGGTYLLTVVDTPDAYTVSTTRIIDDEGRSANPGVTVLRSPVPQNDRSRLN